MSKIAGPFNVDDATRSSITNANEIRGGASSIRASVCIINHGQIDEANPTEKHATHTPFVPVELEDLKGLYVYKEYNGAKYLGTIQFFDQSKKLFKVEYDDYRVEYLDLCEVKKYKATKEDIEEAQQEYQIREKSLKSLSKNRKNSTSTEGSSTGKRTKVSEQKKKEVVKKNKLKQKGTTRTSFVPVKPKDFIGFYVCKEYNGAKYLGTVKFYDQRKKLFKVEYDDYRTEDLDLSEVRRYQAKKEDIEEARHQEQALEDSRHNLGD